MNSNIQLPFTYDSLIKTLYVLRWVALFTFPIMLAYSISINQIPHNESESNDIWAHPLFSWGLIGSGTGWIVQLTWWIMEIWPSFTFKSKSNNEQPNRDEVK